MNSNDHEYGVLSNTPSLYGIVILFQEDPTPKDQVELRKEVEKVREARKEGKWAIIRDIKILLQIESKI